MKKKLIIVAVGALVICGLLLSSGALAVKPTDNGNEMPSGHHYNLNIIGAKNVGDVGNSNGHTLFVNLNGRTKIFMTQDPEGVFKVVDRNGLDDNEAKFNIASGYWDVYARALGKPGGEVNISAYTGELYLGSVVLTRDRGKPQTENLRKLFYVNGDWIFDIPEWEGYYWDYNNDKLKLCQVRFYENTTHQGIQN